MTASAAFADVHAVRGSKCGDCGLSLVESRGRDPEDASLRAEPKMSRAVVDPAVNGSGKPLGLRRKCLDAPITQAIQTAAVGAQPKCPRPITRDGGDSIVRKTLLGRVVGEPAIREPA